MAQRRRERTRGPSRAPTPPPPSWKARFGRWARSVWGIVAAVGLVSLLAGTVYAVRVEPWVKDKLVGESRLRVDRLTQTQFAPLGVVHGGIYLFPGVLAAGPPGNALARGRYPDYEKWAEAADGIPAHTVSYRLVIRGVDASPVLINGIRVDVVSRSAPPFGWFRVPEAACGVQPVRLVALDLDQEPVRPELVVIDEDLGRSQGPYAQTLRVTATEPEVIEIMASSRVDDVRFRITLQYQSERGAGEHVIDGLRVAALRSGSALAYDLDRSAPALVRAPDRDPGPNGVIGFC